MYKTVNWKTGPARARFNLKLKRPAGRKLQAASRKPQAPSLTVDPRDDRMNLERNNYEV